jgi:hypothetical protein
MQVSKDLPGAVIKVTSDPQVLQETKSVGKKIEDILSPTSLTIRKAETTETISELAKFVD